MLEPRQRDVGVVLDDLDRGAARLVISLERLLNALFGMGQQRVGQRDAAFHRQLRA